MCLMIGALVMLGSGCAAVRVSPAALKASSERKGECAADLKKWREAVQICNLFLDSPYRKTLPKGQIRLTDQGMEFVADGVVQPTRVRCSDWGDVLVWFDFTAQERSDGFVVGNVKHARNRLIDNSFFKNVDGNDLGNASMAEMTLHEITHTYYHCGTVSFTTGVRYSLEAIFMFHYRNHSMEKLPFQTSEEFERFVMAQFRAAQKSKASQTNSPAN